MKYYFIALIFASLAVFIIAGPRGAKSKKTPIEIFPDMDRQAKLKAQHPSEFFADGRSERPPIEGTVPIGYEIPAEAGTSDVPSPADFHAPYGTYSAGTDYANTGKMGGFWGDGIPFDVTPAVMERGRERFQINCKVCHGNVGLGNGITSKYGFPFVASLQDDRLRTMPDGEIFNVITHGKGTMFSYGDKVTVKDRWAIIAYIRALQDSQNASVNTLPEDLKASLNTP